jgi:hypothetical protein
MGTARVCLNCPVPGSDDGSVILGTGPIKKNFWENFQGADNRKGALHSQSSPSTPVSEWSPMQSQAQRSRQSLKPPAEHCD